VVNGDIYTDFPFASLSLDSDRDAHLVLVPNPSYLRGDFALERGLAVAAGRGLLTFSGIAVYRPAFFADCVDGVFPLKPLLVRSMSMKRCSAELYSGSWEDVGTPERLLALNVAPSG
jgi:MurNAc alpha-1-phosphate uridylyltransferase